MIRIARKGKGHAGVGSGSGEPDFASGSFGDRDLPTPGATGASRRASIRRMRRRLGVACAADAASGCGRLVRTNDSLGAWEANHETNPPDPPRPRPRHGRSAAAAAGGGTSKEPLPPTGEPDPDPKPEPESPIPSPSPNRSPNRSPSGARARPRRRRATGAAARVVHPVVGQPLGGRLEAPVGRRLIGHRGPLIRTLRPGGPSAPRALPPLGTLRSQVENVPTSLPTEAPGIIGSKGDITYGHWVDANAETPSIDFDFGNAPKMNARSRANLLRAGKLWTRRIATRLQDDLPLEVMVTTQPGRTSEARVSGNARKAQEEVLFEPRDGEIVMGEEVLGISSSTTRRAMSWRTRSAISSGSSSTASTSRRGAGTTTRRPTPGRARRAWPPTVASPCPCSG